MSHLRSPLRRIFRYDMHQLGRFYGIGLNWQNVNNSVRRMVRLDGEPTTLLDFSACNPRIAYQLVKANAPEDSYLSEAFSRPDAKLAMMILLNAKNKSVAIKALAFDTSFVGLGGTQNLARRGEAELLISELEQLHQVLVEAEYFYGSGLGLMRAESDIADRIMTDLRKLRIVCLPIHDGFMVKRKNRHQLKDAMFEHSKLDSQHSIPISVEF